MNAEAFASGMAFPWLQEATARIGHRLTGTSNGEQAERFADSLLRASGFSHVRMQPFGVEAWTRGSVQVTLQEEQGPLGIAAVALAQTPTQADAQGVLIDGGDGLPEDLGPLGATCQGSVLVLNLLLQDTSAERKNLHRSEKVALARQAGAAAVVFVNNVPGHVLLTGTASVTGATLPLPVVCIDAEDGEDLRARMKRGHGLRMSVSMTNSIREAIAHNVIAEVTGAVYPEEVVVVGGHLDSWDLATGATDNGLGAFAILDMARAFMQSEFRPARTIRFALFMGEEQGLLGSRAMVRALAADSALGTIKCMVNLDMAADPFGFTMVGPQPWTTLADSAGAWVQMQDSTFQNVSSEELWLHSDHQPFLLEGIPVILPLCNLGKHAYGCYHSSCDDMGLVRPASMETTVRRVGLMLWYLANAPTLPGHFSTDDLLSRLVKAGVETKLRLQGDWRW
jgi:carboxypeptidase Q